MTKKNRILSAVLALCMAMTMASAIFAAEISVSGGTGNTPVYLSTTDDGTFDGEPAATAMSVTVPTSLPIAMSQNGDVTTATDCKIINNSYGAVRVRSVTINSANNWKLTAFGNKSILAKEKVDSNKLGFSLSIGGGEAVHTDSSNALTQVLISSPVAGCYLSGAGDPTANSAKVDYSAIVTPISRAVTGANIANVIFIVEWDIAA